MTKEEVQIKQEERLPVRDFGRAALHNRHWLVFCVVIFLSILYMTMHNQSTLYYAKYCLGYENISSLLLTLTPFACVVVAFYAGNRRTRGDETLHTQIDVTKI